MSLADTKTVVEMVESGMKSLALVMAGLWTYRHFVLRREEAPRASVTNTVHVIHGPGATRIVHVSTKIANVSQVLLQMTSAKVWIQQVLPLTSELEQCLNERRDPVTLNGCEIEWPLLEKRTWEFSPSEAAIEPGESETLHCDFAVPSDVEQILVYSFVNNRTAVRAIGWSDQTWVDLTSPPAGQKTSDPSDSARHRRISFGGDLDSIVSQTHKENPVDKKQELVIPTERDYQLPEKQEPTRHERQLPQKPEPPRREEPKQREE